MRILKRNGNYEQLSFDKIIQRLKKLCNDPLLGKLEIDSDIVAQKVINSIYDGVSSSELDEEAARIAFGMTDNLKYGELASRIIISNLHKSTSESFFKSMEKLYNNTDTNGVHSPILADDVYEIIKRNKTVLNKAVDYTRDYIFDYFGYKTLEKSYLLKIQDNTTKKFKVIERPQHMYMRVAVGIHKEDIDSAIKTYDLISQHYYTHASPTLFNSGTRLANLSSCFEENTIVTTINKGPIKIKDVVVGDLVITHKGNIKPVVQVHKNLLDNRKLYEINISKNIPIKVTDNHKLWVIRTKTNEQKINKKRVYYNIDYVREFLQNDNCKLISTEYKNIKTKIEYVCMCGKLTKTAFESMLYLNTRCNNKECLFNIKYKIQNKIEPNWVTVDDLRKGDYIGIPNKVNESDKIITLDIIQFKKLFENNKRIVKYSLDYTNETVTLTSNWEVSHKWVRSDMKCRRNHNTVNRFWKFDEKLIKFIGVFYGDGNIITGKDSNKDIINRGITITIHDKNIELIEFCKQFKDIFGINPTIHKTQNITQVMYNSVLIGEIFTYLFGKGFNGKKIWSEMFSWNKKMVQTLLEGLITTDGCITNNKTVSLQLSNVSFMRDLFYLLRNNNIDCSYGKIHRHKIGTQDHIQINIPINCINTSNINKCYTDNRLIKHKNNTMNQYSNRTYNGFKFLRYESKTQVTEKPEYVYTLGVEDDHSYNVGGIIAENCFLLGTNDSLEGIFKTMTDCAKISKVGGGIGLHISNIRAKGSLIRGTNGVSDGIIPMLKVYNNIATYINQSGKRKGSFAIYIEPHHPDILEFLELKIAQGHDNIRARDLFYAIWVSDLFMHQVEVDGDWALFCPDECPGLSDAYGQEYDDLYWKYFEEKKYKRVIKAQDVWKKMLESQIEKGVPYIGFKDAVNKKCNQKNLGTIKSSNLCMEISLYSDDKTYQVCNLASIALPKFIEYDSDNKLFFNHQKLADVAKYIIHPMNKVIDNNHYPTPETREANLKHRPLGIGIQGYFCGLTRLGIPFESAEAVKLNKEIFESLYYGCITGSIELAKKDGAYESFAGSPFSKGKLQFDLAKEFDGINLDDYLSGRWDWDAVRKDLVKYGARNSMLTALMPTASTAQIMNNSECFEPVDSCIFTRRVLSGEFTVLNKYLVKDLEKLGIWSSDLKQLIIAHDGSIQNIDIIPDNIKEIYKTVWEISMKSVIKQSADRQVFVDQMSSMNLFMKNPTFKKLSSMLMYSWKSNLKTGMYYLRSTSSAQASKFSIDPELEKQVRDKQEAGKQLSKEEESLVCSIDNTEDCLACSS